MQWWSDFRRMSRGHEAAMKYAEQASMQLSCKKWWFQMATEKREQALYDHAVESYGFYHVTAAFKQWKAFRLDRHTAKSNRRRACEGWRVASLRSSMRYWKISWEAGRSKMYAEHHRASSSQRHHQTGGVKEHFFPLDLS